ncbi:MAG: hypothetical protein U1C51_08280 [Candidatus Izemoplasmatales bacterium]|nr:hypothetical protein [bacterium]MDZ4197220.1 hypothetical protein [Candidatus Izemoplasmatales bacterium]
MRRFLCVIVLTLLFSLYGCVNHLSTDQASLIQTLQSLSFRYDYVMYSQDDSGIERLERMDLSNPNLILIHIVLSHPTPDVSEDYMLGITSEYVYSTKTMTKTPHQFDTSSQAGIYAVMEYYTVGFRMEEMSLATIMNYVSEYVNFKHKKVQGIGSILGEDPIRLNTVPVSLKTIEIVYRNGYLIELHYRTVFDFESSYSKSNYIAGKHYYFSNEIEIVFPPLDQFSDAF